MKQGLMTSRLQQEHTWEDLTKCLRKAKTAGANKRHYMVWANGILQSLTQKKTNK